MTKAKRRDRLASDSRAGARTKIQARPLRTGSFVPFTSVIGCSGSLSRAATLFSTHPLRHPTRTAEPLHPVNLCRFLAETLPAYTIVTTDVGMADGPGTKLYATY